VGAVAAPQEAFAEAEGDIVEGLGLPEGDELTIVAAQRKEPGWIFLWGRELMPLGG
jgi:hypothetical protein